MVQTLSITEVDCVGEQPNVPKHGSLPIKIDRLLHWGNPLRTNVSRRHHVRMKTLEDKVCLRFGG